MLKKKKTKKKASIKRDTNGKFEKGQSANPNGRKKGTHNKYTLRDLMQAIRTVEKRKRKKFLVKLVETAYVKDNVMIGLARKIIPDLKAIEPEYYADMHGDAPKVIKSPLKMPTNKK